MGVTPLTVVSTHAHCAVDHISETLHAMNGHRGLCPAYGLADGYKGDRLCQRRRVGNGTVVLWRKRATFELDGNLQEMTFSIAGFTEC